MRPAEVNQGQRVTSLVEDLLVGRAALAELSRLIEIPRENIFAAGDHHNDISMLDGRYAQFPACPANAIPEVKDAVRSANGYVAESYCGAGVYEALSHFTS